LIIRADFLICLLKLHKPYTAKPKKQENQQTVTADKINTRRSELNRRQETPSAVRTFDAKRFSSGGFTRLWSPATAESVETSSREKRGFLTTKLTKIHEKVLTIYNVT